MARASPDEDHDAWAKRMKGRRGAAALQLCQAMAGPSWGGDVATRSAVARQGRIGLPAIARLAEDRQVTGQPEERDGLALIRDAARRLERSWPHEVTVGEVLVMTAERCVFVTVGPDGSPVVVKADARPRRTATEQRVLAAARAAGVPVPAVVHADSREPGLLVLEYVPGQPLSSAASASAWAGAGRLLRRLHDMPDPGGIGPAIEWPADGRLGPPPPLRHVLPQRAAREAAVVAQRGLITAGQALRISRLLGRAFAGIEDPERDCVLHGDCQPSHFLLGAAEPDAGLGAAGPDAMLGAADADADLGPAGQSAGDTIAAVIDFGDACTGDPAWDLAVLTIDDPGRLDDVLTGYAPEPRLARRISALAGPYRLLRRLGEASWLADHGFSPEPSVAPLRDAAATEG
jgi:aminoglycoside phosphotransferase (APT) family kinase protein